MCQPLAELLIQALMDQVALSQLMATQCSRLVADAIRVSVRLLLEAVDDLAAALVKENEAAASGSGDKVWRPCTSLLHVSLTPVAPQQGLRHDCIRRGDQALYEGEGVPS